jgi:hypothetical protein
LLLATNDNDFSQQAVSGFPNYIFAFAVDPSDAPLFQPQLSLSANTSPLILPVNFSCRANVGSGPNLAIAGFVISGAVGTTEQLLIRAVGPTLAQFGVSGVLTQPVLTLTNSVGAVVSSNTGWSTNSNATQIATAATVTGAFTLPTGSADSALLINLPPGVYTAQVTGLNGGTGIALVEVYQVP